MVLISLKIAILVTHTFQRTRSLYLLALFQLVGGPAVLLVVMMFGKIGTRHVSEAGLGAGITKALQSEEWRAAAQELLHEALALPSTGNDTEKNKLPGKTKETKGKLFATDLEKPVMAPVISVLGTTQMSRTDNVALVRSHAPPIPPPRWA